MRISWEKFSEFSVPFCWDLVEFRVLGITKSNLGSFMDFTVFRDHWTLYNFYISAKSFPDFTWPSQRGKNYSPTLPDFVDTAKPDSWSFTDIQSMWESEWLSTSTKQNLVNHLFSSTKQNLNYNLRSLIA